MQPPTLIIVGSGPIANELARLGVAYGAAVHVVRPDAEPGSDDPWVHGVNWHPTDSDEPSIPEDVPAGAMVWMSDTDYHHAREEDRFTDRFVVVTEADLSVESGTRSHDVVRVVTGPVDTRPIDLDGLEVADATAAATPTEGAIRVERVAMALLRAAIEEEVPDRLDPADLAHLGDAMMWQ